MHLLPRVSEAKRQLISIYGENVGKLPCVFFVLLRKALIRDSKCSRAKVFSSENLATLSPVRTV